MCHHKLWPTSVSHPFSVLISSLCLTVGKHYQKITITVFRSVLHNCAIPGFFPYIILYRYTYQLVFPKPLTRPLLLKQCLPLGSADQGTGPQLNLLRESVLSGASLCSPQWLRNRGQPAGQPAVVKVSFFHIYILASNDYFIHTCHKSLIKIDTLNMKIGWVFMKIWINNKM